MAYVRNVQRAVEFYRKLGFELGNTTATTSPAFARSWSRAGVEAGPIQSPFYAPRGEFPVVDPDGYALMITHT